MKTLLVIFAVALVAASGSQIGFRVNERFSPKVVGGEVADDGAFPYQISLQWGSGGSFQHVCGGSILSENWVLTAAHCLTELPSGDYQVLAGVNMLSESGQTIDVTQFLIHPEYPGGVSPNDIGLLELAGNLNFNGDVQPISLPAAGSEQTGQSVLSGWGSTSTDNNPIMPNQLMTVNLPLGSDDECVAALVALTGSPGSYVDTNICTLGDRQGACSGDSGGPLAQSGTIVGVVSWGFIPCGTPGAPSIFTQVSKFIDWIQTTCNNCA